MTGRPQSAADADRETRPARRLVADTLALRLFVVIWVSLVVSHAAAFSLVRWVGLPGAGGAEPGTLHEPPPPRGPPPGGAPLPTFPSLPPGPGTGPPMELGPGGPAGLSTGLLLLDYGVRLLIIGVAAWWASRWLAGPAARLARAAEALGPALATGEPTPQLDERGGTSEVRLTARVFNRMAQQIHQLFRSRGLMIAAISHDLRTPLTRLRMRVETSEMPDAQRERFVADVQEMNALIETVLDVFRRLDSRPQALQRTDVTALAQALLDDRAELGAQVGLRGEPLVLVTDPLALRRVLGNLVDNALRYAGSAEVEVEAVRDGARLRVLDRGPGIPPDRLDAMMQPFVRMEDSRAQSTGGAGLGLFIAQELARRLGGQLRLSAREGGGLCAELWLPQR